MPLTQRASQSITKANPHSADTSAESVDPRRVARQGSGARPRRWRRVAVLLLAAVNVGALLSVQIDKAYVRDIAFRLIPPDSDRRKIIETCLEFVHHDLKDNNFKTVNEMPIWPRIDYLYNPRRVGPRMVLEYGTHQVAPCQAHNRAFGTLLDAHGIPWRVVALHSHDLRGSHGIMEVQYDDQTFGMIDSHYGIQYKNRDGSPASLQQLRDDPELVMENQRGARQIINIEGMPPQEAAYPVHEDGYDFFLPAYTNYRELGPFRFWVRDHLNQWFGPNGYLLIRRPQLFSWPAYNLAFAVDLLAFAAVIYLLVRNRLLNRRNRRLAPVAAASIPRR